MTHPHYKGITIKLKLRLQTLYYVDYIMRHDTKWDIYIPWGMEESVARAFYKRLSIFRFTTYTGLNVLYDFHAGALRLFVLVSTEFL